MTKEESISLITKIFENKFEYFKQELKQAAAPPPKKREQKFKYESSTKQQQLRSRGVRGSDKNVGRRFDEKTGKTNTRRHLPTSDEKQAH